MKFKVERIEFSCQTDDGKFAYYLDLLGEKAWGEVYPNDFCKIDVKPAPTKPLSEVQTKSIIQYFEQIDGAKVWTASDGIVSARFKDFQEFSNAIWYTVNKVRKYLKKQTRGGNNE